MWRATALYGSGGEGKTIVAQILATAGALGKFWLGLPVLRCNSLLFFCEDDLDEMHRRQEDINSHFGCSFADLGAMRWLPRLGEDNALMRFEGRPYHSPLFDQLLAAAKEHDAKLIITDTLADIFPGNENDRGQARAFAQQALGLLARETQGAVVALAHPSRAGMNSGSGESGSTAWLGTFRSQLYLATPKSEEGEPADPDLRVLTRRKSNAARRDETIELRWSNGVFVPVHAATGFTASIERRACEHVFLDLLDKATAEGQYVSHNSRAGNYAPRVFALRPDRERFAKADFERAMQRLFAENKIKVGFYKGANRHEHECIVNVPE
jgi:RecA-family ATPase